MKTIEIGKYIQLVAERGYIHRIGSDTYVKAVIMLPDDSVLDFEEVDEIPAYTKLEYDIKVDELVREKYPSREEFAIQRKQINALKEMLKDLVPDNVLAEYTEYNDFVEECKNRAKNSELYKTEEYGEEV